MISKNLMANYLRRRSKGERSKGNQGCKTHPKHKQSPGVCSLCLGDKLSQLPYHSISRRRTITTTTTTTNSSSYSLSSSSSASSSSSPIHDYQYFNTREGKATSFPLMLFASRIRSKQGCDKKKNGGFFSKLLLHQTNNTTMVH